MDDPKLCPFCGKGLVKNDPRAGEPRGAWTQGVFVCRRCGLAASPEALGMIFDLKRAAAIDDGLESSTAVLGRRAVEWQEAASARACLDDDSSAQKWKAATKRLAEKREKLLSACRLFARYWELSPRRNLEPKPTKT